MPERSSRPARALAHAPPEAVAAQLAGRASFVWLDGASRAKRFSRFSVQAVEPAQTLTVTRAGARLDGRAVATPPLALLAALTAPAAAPRVLSWSRDRTGEPVPPSPDHAPAIAGGWIGYLAYEFGELTLPWRSPHLTADDAVLAELARYPAALVWDHAAGTCELQIAPGGEAAADALAAAHAEALKSGAPGNPGWTMGDLQWTAMQERAGVEAAIARVREYIAAGDIYQANIAQAFGARLPDRASAFEHYLMLRRANPAPFSAFLDFPARAISSTSPERFLAVSADGRVEARPIKGTIRIGATPEQDREAVRRLTSSEKERAENVMIVDLLRNDLSRVCRPHTVETPEVCVVETYEGLHHLVSSVTGRLQPGRSALDAVLAAFPGGSITGAPKLRAMEIIAELEPDARGAFCGAIGYLAADGAADFNIAIRTVEYDGLDARMLAGGGVTLLSEPAAEFDETLLKAERVLGAVGAAAS